MQNNCERIAGSFPVQSQMRVPVSALANGGMCLDSFQDMRCSFLLG